MISIHQETRLGRFAAGALLCLLAGCATPNYHDPARLGPFFTPTNHEGVANLAVDLRRVMFLPVSGASVTTPEMVAALNPVFAAALQKENRFEVITLTREEFRRKFGVEEIASSAALPRDFMTVLRRDYAVDAVLFVDLTSFSAYRPLAIGVRAKLATVDEARLLWNFDTVFSAADATVANSARRHLLKQDRSAAPADLSPAVLQSPTRFGGYVAAATFATLPPVYPSAVKNVPVSR
ncbi:MAG: hypothetical protein ABIZ81_16070 [Opitutaceae bacterium]